MKSDHTTRRRRPFLLLVLLALVGLHLGGCAYEKQFVYQPNPPVSAKPSLPISVVVTPFEDGTPEWDQKVLMLILYIHDRTNFAKFVFKDNPGPPLPAERWSRDFAREVEASKAFASVVYAEGGRDPGGSLIIRGKVLSALRGIKVPIYLSQYYDFSMQLQAIRRSDGKMLWERTVSRHYKNMNSTLGEVTTGLWRSMFGEALADLVKELESRRAEWGAFRGETAAPASEAGESVEEILKKINRQ